MTSYSSEWAVQGERDITRTDPRLKNMYEHRDAPLLPTRLFYWRLARHVSYASLMVAGSLLIGTAGFHFFALESVIDAFLNAAMLLGGMGPVGEIRTTPGKLFAAGFSLYAGLVFLVGGAVLLTPVIHRFLHRFHLEQHGHGTRQGSSGQKP